MKYVHITFLKYVIGMKSKETGKDAKKTTRFEVTMTLFYI